MPKNMTSETCAQMLVGEQSHGCVLSGRNFQFRGVERREGGGGGEVAHYHRLSCHHIQNTVMTS